jgi:hypothetical protein
MDCLENDHCRDKFSPFEDEVVHGRRAPLATVAPIGRGAPTPRADRKDRVLLTTLQTLELGGVVFLLLQIVDRVRRKDD